MTLLVRHCRLVDSIPELSRSRVGISKSVDSIGDAHEPGLNEARQNRLEHVRVRAQPGSKLVRRQRRCAGPEKEQKLQLPYGLNVASQELRDSAWNTA